MEHTTAQSPPATTADERRRQNSNHREYLIGIGLLLLVVFLWTAANFLTQALYETGYNKPFLVTYLNTSSFAVYLLPYLFRTRRSSKASGIEGRGQYEAIPDSEAVPLSHTPLERRHPDGFETIAPESLPPLTMRQTAVVAGFFYLFWFVANWSVNAALGYTTVASSTILASTSGFFTLALGGMLGVESFSFAKFAAVATSFAGVVLVSLSDTAPVQPAHSPHPNQFSITEIGSNPLLGDALALLSAVGYALYVILLKYRIRSESRIDMQLFFGFVGVFNIIGSWPIGVILHLTGVEPFSLPVGAKTWLGLLLNMTITLSSDYIYVLAMFKTTPVLVTLGLCLTIPLAVLGDFLLGVDLRLMALLGACFVLLSFIVVGLEGSRAEER
ncbi:hypothetical protein BOTBODRAFT_170660 [Botryobasidium botryosum FD-172 SS1]|uniref:EamA domain-containing protein n=1 Tax=Botryobasidium botryosum (strain FD-172 SS1) TaxID=930990 RepID=A0A067N724_BOTB1|nr:hypothetical protein BOTBODRAFT_170660 [Botryobasidium botryosum FD-172 SS1]